MFGEMTNNKPKRNKLWENMTDKELKRLIEEFDQVPRPKHDEDFQTGVMMKEVAKLIKKYGPSDIYLKDYGVVLTDGRKVSSVRSYANYRLGVFVINKGSSVESYVQDMDVSEDDAKIIYDGVLLAITRRIVSDKSQAKKQIHKIEKRIKEIDKELEELKKLKRK